VLVVNRVIKLCRLTFKLRQAVIKNCRKTQISVLNWLHWKNGVGVGADQATVSKQDQISASITRILGYSCPHLPTKVYKSVWTVLSPLAAVVPQREEQHEFTMMHAPRPLSIACFGFFFTEI